jgi:hypothetical protein
MKNPKPMFERNPKVIPCLLSPRIFMKFQVQWMNKKEARFERTMNQQLDEIERNPKVIPRFFHQGYS